MIRLLFVFGTRPEAIKVAPVILAAMKSGDFDVKVCVTGQHRQMLDQVLQFFGIVPNFDLNLMKPDQTLNGITKCIVEGLEKIFLDHSFDCVLVHGDTTTTMASSLAAFHRKLPVAHIEAGLRTFDLQSPWPEEMNRRLAGILASYHFAPTNRSFNNLIVEGISKERVFKTGNTVIDALQFVTKKIEEDHELKGSLQEQFQFLDDKRKMVLVTGHRRENFGNHFADICKGIRRLAEAHDIQVVYPVHLNPNVQEPVNAILGNVENIHLLQPQDYVPFIYLMMRSTLIITDSGGVQEEAPSLGKPVLVMRNVTERPEAVEAGTVKLVGPNGERIFKEASLLLSDDLKYQEMTRAINPYGDGFASKRILEILKNEIRV